MKVVEQDRFQALTLFGWSLVVRTSSMFLRDSRPVSICFIKADSQFLGMYLNMLCFASELIVNISVIHQVQLRTFPQVRVRPPI